MGNVFINGLLFTKSVWDHLVFTLLFLMLIANHYAPNGPVILQRPGRPLEGKYLAVVKPVAVTF